ncbi:DUF397 domain-containing protein [Actinokineospora spheciospongiae]|uniref:DUF397 domain-containing protein n=1 Tax=Actinokineospora spheciospongiae TaxID=909613 RepID=UPI000D70CA38|nr:DUF397 domain-containing protein [Actinokineospora spheciospongiae]PWW66704.1 uncharacterized protein DUF397 [Actinokineospora spheciospongiae]
MEWRKSSRSGNTGDCVELRQDLAAVRDSKRPGVTLPASRTAVRELITRLSR